VLYSDGLVENRRRGLDVGLDELVAVAAEAPPRAVEDPAMLLDYLLNRMLTGYEQDDDVTVLVVHSPRQEHGTTARRVRSTATRTAAAPAARRGKA
jgi:serine phosphatase RsbU (regulator of sigma subunit)